ncbi:uncharacterized protein [Porites lutea]|uniref:uncharacterized protein n=1 Tax=Porites lutea TaxID=51062 RepID=UPI003CC53BFF
MAARTQSSECFVFDIFQSKNEPLTFSEIVEISSLPPLEAEKVLQRLESEQKICLKKDSEATLYVLNVPDDKMKQTAKPKTPATFRVRPALAARSSSKLRQPFKSPLQSKQQNMLAEEEPTLSDDIHSLEAKLEILDREIEELSQEYSEEELQQHIDKLHEYNEIKDVGQLLIGKLAEIDGTTTKDMYKEFGLNLED